MSAKSILKFILSVCVTTSIMFSQTLTAQSLRDKLSQAIETASDNQLQIVNISPTPLQSIYQVELNTGEFFYADAAGDYLFSGEMFRTSAGGLVNISSDARRAKALEKIALIPNEEMIVFTPEVETRASLTVFTDLDCPYCIKLHGDIEELMSKGIEIRYLAFPRGGQGAKSYDQWVSVLCSDDWSKALTQAKNGQNIPQKDCDSPVLEHYALGLEMGVRGTPALVLPDGKVFPGYADVDRLVSILNLD